VTKLTDNGKHRGSGKSPEVGCKTDYGRYKKSLDILEMENLREPLCLNFASKATKHPRMKKMFPVRNKAHEMTTREEDKFIVQHANTERLRKSSIIYMQNMLNKHEIK
jgi:hypothetical protein